MQQGDTSLREENAILRNHLEVLLKELAELKERIDQPDVALATRGMVSHPFMAKDVPKPKPYKGSRNAQESRGLGDVYKRQLLYRIFSPIYE